MKPVFTVNDFPGVHIDGTSDSYIPVAAAVKFVNAKIEKLIAEAPRVYGHQTKEAWHYYKNLKTPSDLELHSTHSAVLFNIEELSKKKCGHTFIEYTHSVAGMPVTSGRCSGCGKRVVAKWEAVGEE